MIKQAIKTIAPRFLLAWIWQLQALVEQRRNAGRTLSDVFGEIYAQGKWGGKQGDCCSGRGSIDESIVTPYITTIEQLAVEEGFKGTRFVDLGCGDFRVGSRLLPLGSTYVGVDVAQLVIDSNRERYRY